MPSLTLAEWSAVAQIVATVLAAVGIGVSIRLGVRTLKEVQADRELRHRPFLAFENGGHRMNVAFRARGHTLPGINPAYANKVLADMPPDGLSVDLARTTDERGVELVRFYGRLKNYGSGTALSTKVTYVAEEIWIGKERFKLDAAKLAEPIYGVDLNRLPAIPSHVEPGQVGQLSRMPAFVVKDYDRKLSRVEGFFLIECVDVFGNKHSFKQRYHLFTGYGDATPFVHVTFAEMM